MWWVEEKGMTTQCCNNYFFALLFPSHSLGPPMFPQLEIKCHHDYNNLCGFADLQESIHFLLLGGSPVHLCMRTDGSCLVLIP